MKRIGLFKKSIYINYDNYNLYINIEDRSNIKSISFELSSTIKHNKRELSIKDIRTLTFTLNNIITNTSNNTNLNILNINKRFGLVELSDNFINTSKSQIVFISNFFLNNTNLDYNESGEAIRNDITNLAEGLINELELLDDVNFITNKKK